MNQRIRIGIITGTGITLEADAMSPAIQHIERIAVQTRYGVASITKVIWCNDNIANGVKELILLPRHGKEHSIPAHCINYKANIAAMKRMGVIAIFGTAAVGGLKPHLSPGDIVLPDQFVDWTVRRPLSFFDELGSPLVHIDMSQPYCITLRRLLRTAAQELRIPVRDGACYFCADGPRYETAAEVRMMAQLGGDIVGMTSATEAVLAREAEICYATIAVVTNLGAGIASCPLSHAEVEAQMHQTATHVARLLMRAVELYDGADCFCRHALDSYPDVEVPL